MLEFKILVETNREYDAIAIRVKLPSVNNNPMFKYDWGILGLGSSEPKPIFPIGEWTANDTDVCWAWFNVESSWSKTMTFKAKIAKSATKSIELTVYAIKNIHGDYDESHDSISVTGKKDISSKFCVNKLISIKYFFNINFKLSKYV